MTDLRQGPPPRGMRMGVVSVLVAVVLLLGLFTGILLGRRGIAPEAAEIEPVQATTATRPATPLAATSPAAPIDMSLLSAREAVLAGQLAALEARTGALTVTADAAGGQAARAEALLIVVAARRALDRGMPLGNLEGQLQQRFGTTRPHAVAIVRAMARQPGTLEDLRQAFEAIAPAAASGVSDGWLSTIRREFGNLVVLRRAGTPSPRPAEHLARARRLLQADQVEAALAEVSLLPGVRDAANWKAAARRYILARRALDVLESAAFVAPATVPAPAPQPIADWAR